MDQPSAGDDIPYSYSNPDLVSVTHTRLELSVDVENHVLEGRAILTVKKKVSKCNELVLDTYNLLITDVTKGYRDTPYKFSTRKLTFTHEENPHDDNFGRKLKITLPNVDSAASSSSKKRKVSSNIYYIQVIYKTSPDSPALYWLRREQTFDDKFLLISNTKLTYARAIFPCQDTPSNRTSFYSKIYVPSGRGLDVMMPGKKIKEDVDDDKVEYTFFHPRNEPMAPYEIYIIIGSQREVISNSNLKCNLWTEQKYSHEATWAIHKIMTMLSNIKESYGFLGKVNVCVLPPNVPKFDMQIPDMTFVSSTLLGGHYSMIDTIVQNIIESWIGRIVPIKDFKDLWLIKGLSTFIYRNPINNIIADEDIRDFLKIKGINNVLKMPELKSVCLVPVFTNALLPMNIIKYVSEKGCVFLNYLQNLLGGHIEFNRFLVNSLLPLCREDHVILTTNRFKNSLYEHFRNKHTILNNVDWERWFNVPTFPPSHHNPMIIRSKWHFIAEKLVAQQEVDYDLIRDEVRNANDFVKIEFLTYLLALPAVPRPKLQLLGCAFLDDQKICEIRFLWLRLCIKSRDLNYVTEALKFASEYCMPKYACSIFRDLHEFEQARSLARSWFIDPDNRSKMLPKTIKELESILDVDLSKPEFRVGTT
ncbi:leukotriene A-4 hydrolase-like isoform X1 [Temnothorax longispinosus]|uniref:leukotriene A-4 hydrolase-like isoform X1 n=1 Tax=Temnothorax longispinosus TaxID=300112 RepID=UPI003A99A9D4